MTQISPASNAFARLTQKLRDRTSETSLQLVRNTCLAASATATAIAIASTQVAVKGTPLVIAVYGAAIAAPIWLAVAVVIELYLHMGESTYTHLNDVRVSRSYTAMQYAGALSLYVSVSAIVYYLSPWAFLAFVLSTLGSAGYVVVAYTKFAIWLDRHDA
ncbi:MAG: hypothetical protein Q7U63_12465 [Polaromonas sp.]|uniref:hypothetical protein n=1 Tax=Polaromonas sp. TaxID=1869339 RepID=UPI0027242116|nr:hypothetical protein [Polaromonas sp.]MDO9114590.1 hypothetical protein [Polaromonas sp.]MDP1889029.1 hypothetical protein [Polaromonas sp.]